MGTYRNLIAWQKAMDLVDAVYCAVRTFPQAELYCLSQQMRTAAVSIPSNLAEGRGRHTFGEERQFLRQARGSTYELQTQIEIAARQRFVTPADAESLMRRADEVGRLINGLLRSLPPNA